MGSWKETVSILRNIRSSVLSPTPSNLKVKNLPTYHTYEAALTASTEYFGGDDLAARVFVDKYALRDTRQNILELTPKDMHRRIAKEFARIEAAKYCEGVAYTEETIFNALDKFKRIVPQGSPMYGIGNPYQTISLSNCYVIESPQDSYAGICRAD